MASERELDADERSEVQEFATFAAAALGVEGAEPDSVIEAIDTWLTAEQGRGEPDEDLVIGVGSLLGEQYVAVFDWQWCYVTWHDLDASGHAVCSADRSVCITPIQWVYGILTTDKDPNVQLHFNLLSDDQVPDVPPGSYTIVH